MSDRRSVPQEGMTLEAAAWRARALAAQLLQGCAGAHGAQRDRELAARQALHACALTMRALAARLGTA